MLSARASQSSSSARSGLIPALLSIAAQRFETAEEFLLALERGAARPVAAPQRVPLAERNPLLFWRMLAAVSMVANLILLMLLLALIAWANHLLLKRVNGGASRQGATP